MLVYPASPQCVGINSKGLTLVSDHKQIVRLTLRTDSIPCQAELLRSNEYMRSVGSGTVTNWN